MFSQSYFKARYFKNAAFVGGGGVFGQVIANFYNLFRRRRR
jgi:hypothetical protein